MFNADCVKFSLDGQIPILEITVVISAYSFLFIFPEYCANSIVCNLAHPRLSPNRTTRVLQMEKSLPPVALTLIVTLPSLKGGTFRMARYTAGTSAIISLPL